MDDVLFVGCFQSVGDLARVLESGLKRERSLERFTIDQFAGERRRQDLQRNITTEPRIARLVDHAACADGCKDFVGPSLVPAESGICVIQLSLADQ